MNGGPEIKTEVPDSNLGAKIRNQQKAYIEES